MPETGQSAAVLVMERIRLAVLNHDFADAGRITISIGVTNKSPDESLDGAIIRADAAMYQAKETGRNRTEYR